MSVGPKAWPSLVTQMQISAVDLPGWHTPIPTLAPQWKLWVSKGVFQVPLPGLLPAQDLMCARRQCPAWHGLPSVLALECACGCYCLTLATLLQSQFPCHVVSCQVSSVMQHGSAHHHPHFSIKNHQALQYHRSKPTIPLQNLPPDPVPWHFHGCYSLV